MVKHLDSRRGKIKVQPTAVSRRKFKNGGRQKQDTSRKRKLELSSRRLTLKRERSFAKTVKLNKLKSLINHRQKDLVAQCHQQQHILSEREKFCRLLQQKQIKRLTNSENEVLSNSVFC